MTCDAEFGQEEYTSTWTPEEIAVMEAEVKLAQAKAEAQVVKMANQRGWSSSYVSKMKRDAMAQAEQQAHQAAHDRHFLRQAREAVQHSDAYATIPVQRS
jgi:hypothetical protein